MSDELETEEWLEYKRNIETTKKEIEDIFQSINNKMAEIDRIIGKKD